MNLGTLLGIYRYPVKSLRGEPLGQSAIDENGLEGDRERAIVEPSGPRAGKPRRGKEHPEMHLIESTADAVTGEDRYFDDSPVSLILDRWLDGLSSHVGYRVEYQRFRPNLFVASTQDVPDEAALTGRELALGEVVLRVRYPIERCVVTTYDLKGAQADPRILRYLAQERSAWMGIYCDVPRAGIVRIGDSLSLIER